LRADLDQVEALAPEREALWSRLQATTFLTDDEKRTAIGYSPKVGLKYTPDQPRDDNGRWTNGGSSGSHSNPQLPQFAIGPVVGPDGAPVVGAISDVIPVADKPNQLINLLEEDDLGGHTFREHVGKSEAFLKARIAGGGPLSIYGIGEKRYGSFPSLEAANKLVNSAISENQNKIDKFVKAEYPFWLPELNLFKTFGSITGYESYAPSERRVPIIRDTNGIQVRLIRTNRTPKGYYINSAFPVNED
jgi:hypothetical protein